MLGGGALLRGSRIGDLLFDDQSGFSSSSGFKRVMSHTKHFVLDMVDTAGVFNGGVSFDLSFIEAESIDSDTADDLLGANPVLPIPLELVKLLFNAEVKTWVKFDTVFNEHLKGLRSVIYDNRARK